jgi:hypothetical protein
MILDNEYGIILTKQGDMGPACSEISITAITTQPQHTEVTVDKTTNGAENRLPYMLRQRMITGMQCPTAGSN